MGQVVAIMQPYLLPHLAYFKLMRAADQFLVFDDVQYIKRGWVNRNSILRDGRAHRFTAPVVGSSRSANFNTVEFADQADLLATLRHAYARAPFAAPVLDLVTDILVQPDRRVASVVAYSLRSIWAYLGLSVKLSFSSEANIAVTIRGQDRILGLCSWAGATTYVNAAGGRGLYDRGAFSRIGVDLRFLNSEPTPYPQAADRFVPDLSIVDALMFNTPAEVRTLLSRYTLDT